MQVNEWAKYITEWRHRKGFKTGRDNAIEKIMLIVTEVDEAADAADKGDAAGFAEELADIEIRILDLAAACGVDLERHLFIGVDVERTITAFSALLAAAFDGVALPQEDMLMLSTCWHITRMCSKAAEAVRRTQWEEFGKYLTHAFRMVIWIAMTRRIDLDAEIAKKMKCNETRPHMHGKVA